MSDKPGAQPPSSRPLADLRDDAQAAAAKLQTHAGEAANSVRETAASATEEARTQGEEILGAARERAEDLAEDGKEAAAEQASGFATAIRHAAEDLEDSSPEIARHVRSAADSVEGISAALRDRSAGQLMQDVTDFARRQPAAFFGAAALAGFALARFAKSSAEGSPARTGHPHGPAMATPHAAPGWIPSRGGDAAKPATMAAASLGGAAAHRPGGAMPGSMPVAPAGDAGPVVPARAIGTPPAIGGSSDPMPNDRTGTPL
ncbi:MAG TPA: hypothetical protein VIL69_17215 [Roseomonas sp.]